MSYQVMPARLKSLAMALALHVGVLMPWGCTTLAKSEQTQPRAFKEATKGELEVQLLAASPSGSGSCESYKGIGIRDYEGIVLDVAPNGPADQAGLQVGDMIINEEILGRNRYEIGDYLRLKVMKQDNSRREILVRISWICEEHATSPTSEHP